MLIKIFSAAVQGVDAALITIEVNSSRGCMFYLVGLPDSAIKESHKRIISALEVNGYRMPTSNITINMAPADVRKEGALYDLPLAVGLLAVNNVFPAREVGNYMVVGELGLDGTVHPVKGALAMAVLASTQGFSGLILPAENAVEAAVVEGLKVYGVSHLKEVVEFLGGRKPAVETVVNLEELFHGSREQFSGDFAEVRGQRNIKRALEVAAGGGHNLIMVGPPGSGKSMMAKCLPSVLPPLTLEESLETTKIHSVAGKLGKNLSLITTRPFRDPHHTISQAAMVGGGSYPQPGEISLAHNGVLFLDELPEFTRPVLEVLRQPLEDRKVTISRAKFNVDFPAGFMLVTSMNPCPCGYFNHPSKACVCNAGQVRKYLNKVSGPLLDRIDIQVEIVPVSFEEITAPGKEEGSGCIRERVVAARKIQEERYREYPGIYTNARMSPFLLDRFARPDPEGTALLKSAMARLNLSARAYTRILKVARTIADLENSTAVEVSHLAEAIGYRNLDRENWVG